jgi:hypothetical protein
MPGSPAASRYSAADPYRLLRLGRASRTAVGELKNYTAFKDRMLQRPAVERALDDEKIKV